MSDQARTAVSAKKNVKKKRPDSQIPRGVISPEATARRAQEAARLKELTGWPWDTRELAHFYARPLVLGRSYIAWRRALVERILEGKLKGISVIPGEGSGTCEPAGSGGDRKAVSAAVDAMVERLREIARILAVLHGTPDLGNKKDPVDELIYIILSRKTRESAYQEAFGRLKKRFRSWDKLLETPVTEVARLVRSSGLESLKIRSIYGVLERLRDEFGSCTLEPLRDLTDDEVEKFLCSLPDIQRKSAYCVMLFSLGRPVFPADTHVGRLLARLEPFRELGLDLNSRDHRQRQEVLRHLVPPDLMRSLHVNLIEHGRKVCTSARPACDRCELSRFCNWHRRQVLENASKEKNLTMVDLFCGAGGMSAGFAKAGFRSVAALDSDQTSCRTYALNHPEVDPDHVITGDIQDAAVLDQLCALAPEGGVDVLVGGPPCQGFSAVGFRAQRSMRARRNVAGIWEEDDDRNYLFEYFVEVAARLKPRLVVMENVPGMDAARGQRPSFMEMARLMLEAAGYQARIWDIDSAAYGVPQNRLRKFLIASRADVAPPLPEPEYRSKIRDLDRFPDLLPGITVMQAIGDLPPVEPDDGDEVRLDGYVVDEEDRSLRHFVTSPRFPIRSGNKVIYNHRARYNNEFDLELFGLLRPGENGLDVIKKHGRGDLMRYRRDVFHDKYSRMPPDQPSRTIVSHLSRDGNSFVHPEQVRTITPREGARLQSFPDSYVFCGSQGDQWRQIGNAVPPLLAYVIATVIRDHLERFFKR